MLITPRTFRNCKNQVSISLLLFPTGAQPILDRKKPLQNNGSYLYQNFGFWNKSNGLLSNSCVSKDKWNRVSENLPSISCIHFRLFWSFLLLIYSFELNGFIIRSSESGLSLGCLPFWRGIAGVEFENVDFSGM